MENLRERVFAALDKAVANGYKEFLMNQSYALVAADLYEEDGGLWSEDLDDLIPYVVEWREKHKK